MAQPKKSDYSYCKNCNNNVILLQSMQYFERFIEVIVVNLTTVIIFVIAITQTKKCRFMHDHIDCKNNLITAV